MKYLTIIAISIFQFSCNAQDKYGLRDQALPMNSFSELEKQNLQNLRDDWLEVSDKFIISATSDQGPLLNLLFDSMALDRPISTEDMAKGLIPIDYDWLKDKPIDKLGILGNDWRNKSINPNYVYATKENFEFFIFNYEGEEVFSFARTDTLGNDQVFHYNATFCFIYTQKNIGYFLLTRNEKNKPWTDFRIYSLSGEPLTSWKKREIVDNELAYSQDVDVFFGGVIQRNYEKNTVEIISFNGDEIFSMKNCEIKFQPTFPRYGLYKVMDIKNRKAYLVNFQGEKIEIEFDNNYKLVKLK